jgi:formylglycine-generating enzyme required for sulfatase activity
MDIILDKSGFPMVRVDSENFWIHIWPVTKIQLEFFLCEEPNSEMDANWYGQLLTNNPRVSPTRVTSKNYWQLFVAGVHPDKVQTFAEWNGKGYSIPTLSEWNAAYKYFSESDSSTDFLAEATQKMSERKIDPLVNVIDQKLRDAVSTFSKNGKTSFADLFLMRRGMVEWVKLIGETSEWGGMGDPNALSNWSTTSIIGQGRAEIVRNLNVKHYGFRLIKRG